MSQEFVTLTRQDPEFESYLLGTFSKTLRALPVETFDAQTYRERVTFRVLPLNQIKIPVWWKVYFWSGRPDLAGLVLGPAIAAWLNHPQRIEEWTRWPSWLALLGVFFLNTAAYLYNDVQDHLLGADRLNRQRGSQVIQKGWTSAFMMKRWALLNFVLAVLFGVPAFLNAPLELTGICFGALAALTLFSRNIGSRYGLCDLAVLFLFGPLLTMGVALASFGQTSVYDFGLGLAFGTISLWVFQLRQFENLFRSRPEGFRTFIGHLSFDRARVVALLEVFILLALQPVVAVMLRVPLTLVILLPVASLPAILLMNRIWKSASPLSSTLLKSSRWALLSHLSWSAWWILALGTKWL